MVVANMKGGPKIVARPSAYGDLKRHQATVMQQRKMEIYADMMMDYEDYKSEVEWCKVCDGSGEPMGMCPYCNGAGPSNEPAQGYYTCKECGDQHRREDRYYGRPVACRPLPMNRDLREVYPPVDDMAPFRAQARELEVQQRALLTTKPKDKWYVGFWPFYCPPEHRKLKPKKDPSSIMRTMTMCTVTVAILGGSFPIYVSQHRAAQRAERIAENVHALRVQEIKRNLAYADKVRCMLVKSNTELAHENITC